MDIITRSCVLFLWLHTLPFVKSHVCTRDAFLEDEELNDGSFNTVGLKPTYLAGEEVRVTCRAGYSGFFKLQCLVGGRWRPISSKCTRKSCGHPGNAPNADFALILGSDYVFGSRVIYTCHEGYRMVSRRNSRNCLERGWDGVIPVCEEISVSQEQHACSKLPDVPHANVKYKEGDVIDFTCQPGYSSAQPSKYRCTSNGWLTISQGKCFSCSTLPDVPHAHVSEETRKSDYQLGDVIHFSCESGFASTATIRYVCSTDGWLAVGQGTCR